MSGLKHSKNVLLIIVLASAFATSCQESSRDSEEEATTEQNADTLGKNAISEPLITDMYTADPSAHVFDGKIYIYPSHDEETDVKPNDAGDHFAMKDYHVFSMDSIGGKVTDHGVALDVKNVPWAKRQLWAPDAAEANGKYYLYFPGKDKDGVFRIGVATGNSPAGPFKAQPKPIEGSFSIDPAVFKDSDSSYYMYFGGIWGGQLERWVDNTYDTARTTPPKDQPAITPKVARLNKDMLSFAEPVRDVQLLHSNGMPILAGENDRRFFEAAWVHKYNGKYYFSYSTGDTHYIAYATGDSPYGPFTYRGVILNPVIGWTNHHSIVEFKGKWYLFYHDSVLSGGQTHLRNIKMTELKHLPDGSIETISAYRTPQ
ncbi:glycoside hydrolase family 43 protein [Telluribacter humicola]|uniref:glycoside hydrolase family 43 protein n=1 Tax=Telluribacter humicola TaxID=1720261 RepID=UPI001A95ACAE|nr:glycoside hydrolase family 43 protein [Telluribacter humicola]